MNILVTIKVTRQIVLIENKRSRHLYRIKDYKSRQLQFYCLFPKTMVLPAEKALTETTKSIFYRVEVITNAGYNDSNGSGLVYIAAFARDEW
jgi:hypothetical protein